MQVALHEPVGAVLQVPDARAEPWYLNSAWFAAREEGGAGALYFAGVALRAPCGAPLGALCVLDARARAPLQRAQQDALRRCARQVSTLLELRRAAAELAAGRDALLAAAQYRDRLRAERAAARAETVAQRSHFVSLVEDEVRAPLAAVAEDLSSLALADAPPSRDALDALAVAATHLQLTVNSLLDYGINGHEATFSISPQPCDLLRAVLAPALRLAQHIQSGGARLLRTVAPGVPGRVTCDASRVVQVLTKLLTSAFAHAAKAADGAVTLSVRTEDDGRFLAFEVADNGCGMSAERAAAALRPGQRREGGLAACARLAAAMGGQMRCDSKGPGSGCAFTLRVPLLRPPGAPQRDLSAVSAALVCHVGGANAGAPRLLRFDASSDDAPEGVSQSASSTPSVASQPQPPPRPQQPKPGQRADGAPMRILVAEDDRVSQVIVRKLLLHVGADVTIVGDGETCVEAYRRKPNGWDLILLDVNMPILDGPGAARAMRDLGCTTPMVALTAHAGAEVVKRCLNAGMVGHLSKPVRPETLSTLRPFAEGRAPRPEDEEALRAWLEESPA